MEKKFKEWAAAIIKPGGAVVDHRPQTRIKIHQAKGTYAAVTTLVAAHGFKLSGCDRCGKWRRLSDVLSKRRGGFVCADINDENVRRSARRVVQCFQTERTNEQCI